MTLTTINIPLRKSNREGSYPSDSNTSGALEVSLGNDALISAKRHSRAENQIKKENKFALLDYARLLLQTHDVRSSKSGKEHRTRFCLATRIDSSIDVGITLNSNPEQSRAGLVNVQTCRSICSCPVCAERMMLDHALDVKKALIWAENEGLIPVLVSLTASHHAGMNLADFKDQFKAAWRMFSNHRTWRDYKEKFQIEHWIAAREATREAISDNGWHYHMHILVFVNKGAIFNAGTPENMQAKFTEFWLKCLVKKGLTGSIERACDVRAGEHVGAEYLTKLGVNETMKGELQYELTGGANKGHTIWDVLSDAMWGDIRSVYLYIEYVQAMQGENWITTSHGLQDLIADIELPVSGETESDKLVLWMNISPENWRVVVRNRAVHAIIRVAATYRAESRVLEYIEALRE
jgi:hypothetical protein